LIANAGIYEGPDQPLAAVDSDFWLDAFRVNTMAPLLFACAFRANKFLDYGGRSTPW